MSPALPQRADLSSQIQLWFCPSRFISSIRPFVSAVPRAIKDVCLGIRWLISTPPLLHRRQRIPPVS
ncbi:hypothetical protein TB2_026620 [Malus domestica]